MRRSYWTLAALMSAVVAVSDGCKKAPPPAPPAAPEPAPAPLSVIGVDLGKAIAADKSIAAPATTFGVRDTIYASVSTTGVSSGATLTAIWSFQTGQRVDSTSQSVAPTGPAKTEFHISKATAWPAGKYKVEISLNGGAPTEREFEIKR